LKKADDKNANDKDKPINDVKKDLKDKSDEIERLRD
jgi:hypothetical protein